MSDKSYLQVNERELIKDLQLGVIEILFEKVNCENRLMRATLQPSYFGKPFLTEQERQHHANALAQGTQDPGQVRVLHVWDVEAKDWRSFRMDKILSMQLTAS